MKMFKSLKNRLLTYFLLANILVFVGFSLFIYETAKKGISDTLDSQLKILSLDAIADLLDGKKYVNSREISMELKDEFGISSLELRVVYYSKSEKSITYISLSNTNFKDIFDVSLNEMGHLHSIYYFDKQNYRVSSMLLFEDENTKLFFQAATKKIENTPYLNTLINSLLWIVPLLILFLLFIANLLLNKSLSPVQVTINNVNKISAVNLSQRLCSKKAPLEIKALIDTFNMLLDRLEKSFERISTFSSDASHELKTPLTVIRGEAEISLRKERSTQEYKQVLEHIVQESTQVQQSIEQLFLLTRKDTKELSENFQELYLDEVLGEILTSLEKEALHKSIVLNLSEVVPVSILANEVLLKTAITNLIRNSILYSEEGSEISLCLRKISDKYILSIKDSGCGISEEDLPHIFERFFRVDKARSRQNLGTGLGLAIVKMILDLHHYLIVVKSSIGEGTRVEITFPQV